VKANDREVKGVDSQVIVGTRVAGGGAWRGARRKMPMGIIPVMHGPGTPLRCHAWDARAESPARIDATVAVAGSAAAAQKDRASGPDYVPDNTSHAVRGSLTVYAAVPGGGSGGQGGGGSRSSWLVTTGSRRRKID
jgi:hypothetical protein